MSLTTNPNPNPTTELDHAAVVEVAREVAYSRGPDFTYNPAGKGSCFYTPEDAIEFLEQYPHNNFPDRFDMHKKEVGCAVGETLKRFGIDLTGQDADIEEIARDAYDPLPLHPRTLLFLMELQTQQDNGLAWPASFELAAKATEDESKNYYDLFKGDDEAEDV